MANAAIPDYYTMIQGLTKYMTELDENCTTLNEAVQMYDDGINDKTSKMYRLKIGKLCNKINPSILEQVEKLRTNLIQQVQLLEEEDRLQEQMNNE